MKAPISGAEQFGRKIALLKERGRKPADIAEMAPASYSDAGVQLVWGREMLAVVSFPIFDPRDWLSKESDRLRQPSWPSPRAAHPVQFMRQFGAVFERSAGGLKDGEFNELRLCDATRALRFKNLTRFRSAQASLFGPKDFQPAVRQRHFFFDGRLTGKLEVGFTVDRGWRYEELVRNALPDLVSHLLNQQVVVGRGAASTLSHAGPAIAELYQQASTWRPKLREAGKVVGRSARCRAGTPLVTVSVAASARNLTAPHRARAVQVGRCHLVSWRASVSGMEYVVVAIVEESRRNSDVARNLRLLVTRIHAELSCIENGLEVFGTMLDQAGPDETREILVQFGDPLGDKIGKLDSLLHRIGKSASSLMRAGKLVETREMGEAVLRGIWSGRYAAITDRHDLLMRRSLRADVHRRRGFFEIFKREPRVFISYRRKDTGDLVDKLEHALRGRTRADYVYRDVTSNFAGENWRQHLLAEIQRSDIVLVVLGNAWSGPVTPLGRPIDEADDVFRLEIEFALEHGKRIIPLIAPGCAVPPTEQLPPSIAPLADLQAQLLADDTASLEAFVESVIR